MQDSLKLSCSLNLTRGFFLFVCFLIIYLFILAVLGLHYFEGFSQAAVSRGYSLLWCLDFLLRWLLLLQSTGFRAHGLHSPGSWAQELRSPLQSAGSAVVMHRLSCSAACGILQDQESNLRLLHWQMDSPPLSHQGTPFPCFYKFVLLLGEMWFKKE